MASFTRQALKVLGLAVLAKEVPVGSKPWGGSNACGYVRLMYLVGFRVVLST